MIERGLVLKCGQTIYCCDLGLILRNVYDRSETNADSYTPINWRLTNACHLHLNRRRADASQVTTFALAINTENLRQGSSASAWCRQLLMYQSDNERRGFINSHSSQVIRWWGPYLNLWLCVFTTWKGNKLYSDSIRIKLLSLWHRNYCGSLHNSRFVII